MNCRSAIPLLTRFSVGRRAPKPGPLTVPAGELGKLLGIRTVTVKGGANAIAVADESLAP